MRRRREYYTANLSLINKKIIASLLFFLMILGGTPLTAFGLEQSNVSQYLDKTVSVMVDEKEVKGAVVAVVKNMNIEHSQGYGFADEEQGIAADNDTTAFRIGSISKTFVAIAALQLVEEGRLDMNAPITEYLESDFPKFKYDITIHELLTHTAGFEDMISGIAVHDLNNAEPLALSVRKYMPAQVFVPGEVVSYSNYGIALAAYVVERISGQDFHQYVDNHVFKPLGMTETSFELDYNGVAVSKAYATDGQETSEPFINLYPEGSVVSTADNMAKYMLWLMDDSNKILNAKAKQQLFNQQHTMFDEFEGMGYTWSRKEHNDVVYYAKKGETVNFYSRIVLYPDQKTGVFLSFNTYVNEGKLNSIMSEVTDLLIGTEKQNGSYTGEQTADLSGYYITTRSNFETLEKVMNFMIPNRVVNISGNLSDGFKMNGEKLSAIGENYYSTPIGELKYIERDGRSYLATETATSYVQTHWYESNGMQRSIFGFFTITSLIMAALSIFNLIRRKRCKMNYYLTVLSVSNLALFTIMSGLIVVGISNYNMLDLAPFIKMCGMIIIVTSLSGVSYGAYLWKNKIVAAKKNIPFTVWNISSILFCLWMVQVNIV